MVAAARDRRVPLTVIGLDIPDIAVLYERKLVLVRPDGHVAWRGDELPADAGALMDRVRGAVEPHAAMHPAGVETVGVQAKSA